MSVLIWYVSKEETKNISLDRSDVETIFANLKENFELPKGIQKLTIDMNLDNLPIFAIEYYPFE